MVLWPIVELFCWEGRHFSTGVKITLGEWILRVTWMSESWVLSKLSFQHCHGRVRSSLVDQSSQCFSLTKGDQINWVFMISLSFVLIAEILWTLIEWQACGFFSLLPRPVSEVHLGKMVKKCLNNETKKSGVGRGLVRMIFRLVHHSTACSKGKFKTRFSLHAAKITCCILNPAMRCMCWAASWALRSSLYWARPTYNALDIKIRPFISVTALVASSGDEKHTNPNPAKERDSVNRLT